MAKTNCKNYPTDNRVMGAVLPLIFASLAMVMFLPSFKHKGKVVLAATILLSVLGYYIGKSMKTTIEICDQD